MKLKRVKIQIENYQNFKEGVIEDFKRAQKRQPSRDADCDLVLSLPDLSYLAKIMSIERLRLLKAIKDGKPESIYQLAKLLNRAISNVQKDVAELAEYGIIELKRKRKKGQKRETVEPHYNWGGFDIAV